MPATITHAFFAKDVVEVLPEEIKKKLDINRCKMFGQSADSLMFYNLFSLAPGKKIRHFQEYFHSHHSQEYFMNILKYMKDNEIQDIDTYSFLVGSICHYALDSTLHPYVIYRTGMFKKGKRTTYKYNNVHAFMEAFIDNDLVRRREGTNPYTFPIGKYCFDLRPFSPVCNRTISYAYFNTFHLSNMDKIYYKSLKQMKNALMTFRRDPYGIKKCFYKFLDTFTPRSVYRFEAISYHLPLEDKHDYLNMNHTLWRHPVSYDIVSKDSFVDLYLQAMKKAKSIICSSFDYLEDKEVDLEQVFLNDSYVTGLNCDDKREIQYFDY